MQVPTDEQKLNVIRSHVYRERERRGVTKLVSGHQSEPSCEMFGEAHNLFEFQLMQRPEAEWQELDNPEVLQMMYEYIKKEESGRERRAVA